MSEFVTIRSRHWRNLLRRVEILESATGEVNSAPGATRKNIRLQKVVERFEEIGGVLRLHEGQILYFVPEESVVPRALMQELVKYRDELNHVLELNPCKVDFRKVKVEICRRFSAVSLSPLDSHKGKPRRAGNSAGAREKEGE